MGSGPGGGGSESSGQKSAAARRKGPPLASLGGGAMGSFGAGVTGMFPGMGIDGVAPEKGDSFKKNRQGGVANIVAAAMEDSESDASFDEGAVAVGVAGVDSDSDEFEY